MQRIYYRWGATKRLWAKFIIDLVIWTGITFLAYALRLQLPLLLKFYSTLFIVALFTFPIKALIIMLFGFYRQSWRKVGTRDLFMIGAGTATYTIAAGLLYLYLGRFYFIPHSIPILEGILGLVILGGHRLASRIVYEFENQKIANVKGYKRILVVGAGEAGTTIVRELLRHPESRLMPVGYLDDDLTKRIQKFLGLPILGSIKDMPAVVQKRDIDEILIAMPSERGKIIRNVIDLAEKSNIQYRTVPSLHEIFSGRISISQIREVDLEDLLRREPVALDIDEISGYLNDKTILVTGAGGSIGSEIVRQVARFKPQKIILFGRGENSIYNFEQEMSRFFRDTEYESVIGDVRDYATLENVFQKFSPVVIFHAAAHKHVPLMEANPGQAILNNVGGTKNLVELSLKYGVERFVNISTDKAVNPTSIMGASKRVAEQIVQWASNKSEPFQSFVSVRFGNVLGSRGSVIPVFKNQIKQGGPVTVTHPDMQRYFMTIPEASQLVLQAGGMARNGAVYLLNMGESIKIVDLASDLIKLSGFIPEKDIKIKFTGIRPGEKLFEELLTEKEGTSATRHEKIFEAHENGIECENFNEVIDELFAAAKTDNDYEIKRILKQLIPTFKSNGVMVSLEH